MKLPRRLVGEGQACALVRGHVALLAPGRKGTRTNPDPGDAHTSLLQLSFSGLGALQPRLVSRRQLVGVAEQSQQGCVVTPTIPRQCNDGGRCNHGSSPDHETRATRAYQQAPTPTRPMDRTPQRSCAARGLGCSTRASIQAMRVRVRDKNGRKRTGKAPPSPGGACDQTENGHPAPTEGESHPQGH